MLQLVMEEDELNRIYNSESSGYYGSSASSSSSWSSSSYSEGGSSGGGGGSYSGSSHSRSSSSSSTFSIFLIYMIFRFSKYVVSIFSQAFHNIQLIYCKYIIYYSRSTWRRTCIRGKWILILKRKQCYGYCKRSR